MVQESGDGGASRARSLLEDLATREVVDAFVEANEKRWSNATYKYNCWVLDNFAETLPILTTELHEVLEYVENHTRRKSKYLWEIGTVRSCYKVLRTFYGWTRENYTGAEHLMILPPPSNRQIKNFGKKIYRRRQHVIEGPQTKVR